MNPGTLLSPNLRADFPLLAREHSAGRPLVYLDSAATSLKPRPVIEAVSDVLSRHTANVHRAVHVLGDEATQLFEDARRKVARLIGAEPHEVVLLRNTTEALNLVARCYPRKGRVLVSRGEHHSNLLPWGRSSRTADIPVGVLPAPKFLSAVREGRSSRTAGIPVSVLPAPTGMSGVREDRDEVTYLPPGPDGGPNRAAILEELARGGVAIVTVSHLSNVTGVRTDVAGLAEPVHAAGAILVVDGAQSVPHVPIDVQELGCDFLAFSGHKMCGPSGVGVLFGKAERLAELDWYLQGGGTVEEVAFGIPKARQTPWRFEAGTPAIESAIGLGAAVDYLQGVGLEMVESHCRHLHGLARKRLQAVPGVRLLGEVGEKEGPTGPISFTIGKFLSHMVARALSDAWGICVRSGYHCTQPLHEHLHAPPSLRLSFYLYNQPWEIDLFFEALERILHQGRPF